MRTLEAGQVIPEWSLPMTPTTIVSTAIATRDWQDVHHDRDVAQAAGSRDIFMNILTTNGLVEKFVVDWAGGDAELKEIAIRLGAPAHPYDTLTFSGTVTSVEDGIATIDVVGRVSLGDHVTGTVRVVAAPVVEEGALRPSRNPGDEA
ncbi:MAG TPA: MaoC family dehydratase [Nocardioides sp.]|nr:MaoC family dehydratase [Nocardioides sp.]